MEVVEQSKGVLIRKPTIARNTSIGREFVRTCTWEDGTTTVTLTLVGFVTGIRARRNPDGSIDLIGQMTRFDVLRKDEFLQPIERAVFLWDREREAEDGTTVYDSDMDFSDEIGVVYSRTVEDAEAMVEQFVTNFDFERSCDPGAWE